METVNSSLEEIFENEWYLVRYSGETPEIAFNAAMYYLTRSQQGPGITLEEEQVELLRSAAVDRYTEIIVRDLIHENHNTSVYRGLSRSIINYHRFHAFCQRQDMSILAVKNKAAQALQLFIERELQETDDNARPSIIDCSYEELAGYAVELGLVFNNNLTAIAARCPAVQRDETA